MELPFTSEHMPRRDLLARFARILSTVRMLGLKPSKKTIAKIVALQNLLKEGHSAREAVKAVSLG